MKTITEFSGILLQRAAAAQRTYRAANPRQATPAVEQDTPPAPDAQEPSEGTEAISADASIAAATTDAVPGDGGVVEAAPVAEEALAESANGGTSEEQPGEAESAAPDLGTGPEAEAVGTELQVQGDRLSRLMEALDVVGNRSAQVRLVRVLQGEDAPSGSQKRGEFYYAVDLMPRPQSQQRDGFDSRRGGQGGRDRGGRPGAGGPRGAGGGPGGGAGGQGGRGGKFSNDRPGGRDGDSREPRGEMPRGGAGWMLTRAPEDRRHEGGPPGADRRGDRRPPRGPRFDNRGPRPPQGARPGAGPGGAGPGAGPGAGSRDRFPRGPRPDGAGPRPGPRPQGPGDRPAGGPRFEGRPSGGPGGPPNGGRGPRRPESGSDRGNNDRNWPRRRGGWDEPLVAEPADTAAPAAANQEIPPVAPNLPAPATESAVPTHTNANVPSTDNNG